MMFSNSKQAFFLEDIKASYGDGSWPSDAQDIDKDQEAQIRAIQAEGYTAIASPGKVAKGSPQQGYVPESNALNLASAKRAARELRAPMLDALSGIAGRAARSGDDALAAEADAMSNSLLNITDDPALNAAETREQMGDAALAAYKRIAAAASPALRVVFREITGA